MTAIYVVTTACIKSSEQIWIDVYSIKDSAQAFQIRWQIEEMRMYICENEYGIMTIPRLAFFRWMIQALHNNC